MDNRISPKRCKNVAALIFERFAIMPPIQRPAVSDGFNPQSLTSVPDHDQTFARGSAKAAALAGFYADDAVVRIIDRDNPPSKPRNLEGKKRHLRIF